MPHSNKIFIILSIAMFFLFSCRGSTSKKVSSGIMEGAIKYNITYSSETDANQNSFLFPKEMMLFFKNDMQKLSLKGGLGMYNIDFIYGSDSDTIIALLNIGLLSKKLYLKSTNPNLFIFSEANNSEVTLVIDEIKEFAGLTAKKAVIKSGLGNTQDIEVWYTDEISVNTPNRNTPFEKIPGILLESKISYKNITFSFQAEKIDSCSVSDETFIVPADFQLTTIKEIEDLVNTVF